MEIKATADKDKGRIEVIGDIDEKGAEVFKEKLNQFTALKEIVIDFNSVKYVGSSGIGKLLLFYKKTAVHGGKMSVINVNPDLFRLFQELKLDTIFPIKGK
ncbi:MAG: STAS domain-containing protein [Syntrophales bacterium]|nr:STAS domain-containing protein [Syntrophales bacterium]